MTVISTHNKRLEAFLGMYTILIINHNTLVSMLYCSNSLSDLLSNYQLQYLKCSPSTSHAMSPTLGSHQQKCRNRTSCCELTSRPKVLIHHWKKKPTEDPAKLARLRANNVDSVESKAYQKRVKTAAKLWTDQNVKAYGFIVKACTYSVTAMTVVTENPLITAKAL